jgi:hypothetical protein
MKVTLNEHEKAIAIHTTKMRRKEDRAKGRKDVIKPEDSYDCDERGSLGEMAFAKHFNKYPDFTMVPGDYDFIVDGYRVDVKTSKGHNNHLELKKTARKGRCDRFVLITGVFPEYHFRGWIADRDYWTVCFKKPYDNGDWSWWVKQADLNPMETFLR